MEIKTLLATEKPDGLFISDDLTAILTMRIASDMGIAIPQDLKIVGYDGTTFVENYYAHLTTIKQPISEMAKLIVDVLIQKIEGKTVNKNYILPVSLLSGKSI